MSTRLACSWSSSDWVFLDVLWSAVESNGGPMRVETIDDPTVTQITLKNLDRHNHYRFYLRGRTAAGDGEAITKEGATTLDGGKQTIYRGLCSYKYDIYGA